MNRNFDVTAAAAATTTLEDEEETTELLAPSRHDNMEVESYFIEYAVQKEMINRNRCPAGRRLLGQTAVHLADFDLAIDGNHRKVAYYRGAYRFYFFLLLPRLCFVSLRNACDESHRSSTKSSLLVNSLPFSIIQYSNFILS